MSLLAEGQTLDGTYRLLRLIGEGGMGEVYEATHARLAGRYAIKVLLRDLTQTPDAVARVHRDLKPDNIFLVHVEGREGSLVKILDFGISKISGGAHTQNKLICGTPQYMAPEQVEARTTEIGGATDQFALAVIAYELLTGRNPFMAEILAMIFERVLRGVAAPTGLGARGDAVLARGMAKSHLNRYPSVIDFADALRAALVPVRKPLAPPVNGYVAGEVSPAELRQLRPRRSGLAYAVFVIGGLAALFLFEGGLSSQWLSGRHAHPDPRPQVTAASPVAAAPAPPPVPALRPAEYELSQ